MKPHRPPPAALACAALATLLALPAYGQALPTLDQISGAAADDDWVLRVLSGIFGEQFVQDPLGSVGMPEGLFSGMVFYINAALFVLGVAMLGWIAIRGITQSASDGEPFAGASATWLPIRAGVGILLLAPVFGGYSLSQALLMQAAVFGNGVGNLVSESVWKNTSAMRAIVPSITSSTTAPNLQTEVETASYGLLIAELCHLATWLPQAPYEPIPEPAFSTTAEKTEIVYPGCGVITLTKRQGASARSGDGIGAALGFRMGIVNYAAIATATHRAAEQVLRQLQADARQVAWDSIPAPHEGLSIPPQNTGDVLIDGYARLKQSQQAARASLSSQITSASERQDAEGLNQRFSTEIQRQGWAALGGYSNVFSEASAAITDAQKSWTFEFAPGSRLTRALSDPRLAQQQPYAMELIRGAMSKLTIEEQAIDDMSIIDRVIDRVTPDALKPNAVGERSIGQALVGAITRAAAQDSGGTGLVNPVIAAKNLGDYGMLIGQTLIGGDAVAEAAMPSYRLLKHAARATSPLAAKLGEGVMVAAYVMIGVGMLLSLWVPLSIFATWVTALIGYLRTVFEAFLYAPISAFSHLRYDGDSLTGGSQSAERFYLYILNLLLRPAVLVVAFIAATAASTVVGTFVLAQLGGAIAAAQGNSVTGLLSVAGLLLISGVLLVGVIQPIFSWTLEIPNALLSWLGGQSESSSGAVIGAVAGASMARIRGGGGGASPPPIPPAGPAGKIATAITKTTA